MGGFEIFILTSLSSIPLISNYFERFIYLFQCPPTPNSGPLMVSHYGCYFLGDFCGCALPSNNLGLFILVVDRWTAYDVASFLNDLYKT